MDNSDMFEGTGTCCEHAQRPKRDMKPYSGKTNIRQRQQENGTEPKGKRNRANRKIERTDRKTDCAEQNLK